MMQKNSKLLLTAVMLLLILSSCDLFFIGPSLNINWDDPNAGFGRLDAEQIGKDEIRVSWDWYDIERRLRGGEAVFDEIVIKHNKGSRPTSRLGGTQFELKNWDPATNPMCMTVFDNLERDREHYFALYAHEKDGRWMAPVYSSLHVENSYADTRTFSFNESSVETYAAEISPTGTPADGTITNNEVNIFYFGDIWDEDKIAQAIINIESINSSINDTILVYPMRIYTDGSAPGLGPTELTVDRTIRKEIPVSSTDTLVEADITHVFAKSHYHRTNGILLVLPESSANTVNFDPLNSSIELTVVNRNW